MQMYADAARRAIDAGFDIIYIHGAAGVFPMHALSRHFNRRTDRYGGSFENRARFWTETLETIRTVADGQCAIATRIAIDDLARPRGLAPRRRAALRRAGRAAAGGPLGRHHRRRRRG